MASESINWGYVLVAPGRPSRKVQMDRMAALGLDVGEPGTVWMDRVSRGSTRPRTQLDARNDLLNAIQAGDTVHVAKPFCTGLSEADVLWFGRELASRGVRLAVDGACIDGPKALEDLAAEVRRQQNIEHVRASRTPAVAKADDAASPRKTKPGYCVYRFYDRNDVLLYVGCTAGFKPRRAAHKAKKWYSDVTRVEIKRFKTHREALDAERKAIWEEYPHYNRRRLPPKS